MTNADNYMLKGGAGGGTPVNGYSIIDIRDPTTGMPLDQYTAPDETVWLRTGVLIDDTADKFPEAQRHSVISGVGTGNSMGSISTYMEGLQMLSDTLFLYVSNSSGSTAYVNIKDQRSPARTLFRVDSDELDPSDVTVYEGNYYVIGANKDKLIGYDRSGVKFFEQETASVDTVVYGLKYDKWLDCFWILGSYNKRVYQLTTGGLYTGLNCQLGAATHQALAVDENYLYVSVSNGIVKVMDKKSLAEVTTLNISANLKTILGMDVRNGKLYCNGRTTSTTNYVFSFDLHCTKSTNIGDPQDRYENGTPIYKRIK